ncbi:hypothetical protein BG95_04060 [Thermosipho sp. 1063]|uniref:hypothetical protein n=1 Tax=Thermosipho sp. 1063 TaxID=1462747 RepID=UPI0009507D87|nr:hypothetical protein [Thermosipho sp. 1063]APT73024.1 hypothetical protein BG95_04060 [Thermosipho sp. 1063]
MSEKRCLKNSYTITSWYNARSAFYCVKKYSAEKLVVITSRECEKLLDEIKEEANFRGECEKLLIDDPFEGIDELKSAIDKAKEFLKGFGSIVVNLTGGTTLLGYIVKEVSHKLNFGRKISYVMATDKRPIDEQKKNPYVVGEILEIDIK